MAIGTALAIGTTVAGIGASVYNASKSKDAQKTATGQNQDLVNLEAGQRDKIFNLELEEKSQTKLIDNFIAQVTTNIQNVPSYASGIMGIVNKSFDVVNEIRNTKTDGGSFSDEFLKSIKSKQEAVIKEASSLGAEYNAKLNSALDTSLNQPLKPISNFSPVPEFMTVKKDYTLYFVAVFIIILLRKRLFK